MRRIDLEAARAETLLTTATGTYGNLEGISVWQDDSGQTFMTLVSDDNFRGYLASELVEYKIDG